MVVIDKDNDEDIWMATYDFSDLSTEICKDSYTYATSDLYKHAYFTAFSET